MIFGGGQNFGTQPPAPPETERLSESTASGGAVSV